tara:strand:- start:351 stop:503 length:153 start_codon:yes stop_codon:yes gene_type:complete
MELSKMLLFQLSKKEPLWSLNISGVNKKRPLNSTPFLLKAFSIFILRVSF